MRKALIICISIFTLSACKTTVDPGVSIKGDGYKVEVSDDHNNNSSRNFCPPGQAKKGNC